MPFILAGASCDRTKIGNLDEGFFQNMNAWKDWHPDSTPMKVMEKVNEAVTKNLLFIELVPYLPFLIKALAVC